MKLGILPTQCLYVFHIMPIKHKISLNCLDGLSSILETDSVLSDAVATFLYIISNKRSLQRLSHCSGSTSLAIHRDGPSSPGASPCRMCTEHSGTGSGFSPM